MRLKHTPLSLGLVLLFALVSARLDAAVPEPKFDETTRFIFYSVLEGLYDDGVSSEDVEKILMRSEKAEYFHFIYACPVCMATVWALDSYRSRPDRLHSVKGGDSTFGFGLEKKVRDELHSDDPKRRLAAISGLIDGWIVRRMGKMNLSDEARGALRERLEKKREQGLNMLETFREWDGEGRLGTEHFAPAYASDEKLECAACNGAVGKPMNLKLDE